MDLVVAFKRAIAVIPGLADIKDIDAIRTWKAWRQRLPQGFSSLGRGTADGFAGEATLPVMERLFHILAMCAPNQDVRKLQYFEVGFASGQWMAMAKALGIPVVRGCEVQCGEGMRFLMHVGFASQVANLGGVFDATYLPIEDPEVQLWRDTDDAHYDNVRGAAALFTFSFDVGFTDEAREAIYLKVGSCHRASMLLSCRAQGRGALFTTPEAVLDKLQEAGQHLGKTWEYKGYISLHMSGSGEQKTGWVFADTSGVAVPMEFGWLAA